MVLNALLNPVWNPHRETARRLAEADRFFAPFFGYSGAPEYPAVNILRNEDAIVLTAELPGVDPGSVEINVKNDVVTIGGTRPSRETAEGERFLRRERTGGSFSRSFRLPFPVDSAKTEARCTRGILVVTLPRAEADKPRKIEVKAS